MASSTKEMLARVMYEADGHTSVFKIPFPYISARDIFVYVDNEEALYEFVDSETVEIHETPLVDSVVTIQRETEREEPLVDFNDSSVLLETDLDLSVRQNLFLAQEAYDFSQQSMRLNTEGLFDARGGRIVNVADPVEGSDAVPYQYLLDSIESLQDQVSGVENPAHAQFSTVSWHEQEINSVVEVPENKNAWSFGPSVEIGEYGIVQIGEGSYWTIANTDDSQEDDTSFNGVYDYGVL